MEEKKNKDAVQRIFSNSGIVGVFKQPVNIQGWVFDPGFGYVVRQSDMNPVGNLGCQSMKIEHGYQADNRLWNQQAYLNEIGVAQGCRC